LPPEMLLTISTNKYDLFKFIPGNRPIDEKHVNWLMSAIQKKNLLPLNPIIVNKNFEVVEGQHRLVAAERLGVHIFYLKDDDITKADMASLNKNRKNWSVLDYINYWATEQAPGFDTLTTFMLENPLIPPSTILRLIGPDQGGNSTGKLRDGIVDVSNIDQANYICSVLKEYAELINFAHERNFVLAVMSSIRTPGYDHDTMRRKLEYQSRSLRRCITVKQYCEMLQEIYNYNSSKNLLTIKC